MNIEEIKSKKTTKELLEFGMINIDKSSGPTSFDISDFVRKKLNLRKTSHFGTLDPKVTGVLPIALNRACKLTGYFLGEDKEYVGIMRIHEEISLEKIKNMIKNKFLGKITQMPPVKSSVKRQLRQREIKRFDLYEEEDKNILFEVECEGGTYIRKLLHDLGEELEVGAHMLELRRMRAGIFKEDTLVNLYDFEKAVEEYSEGKGNDKLLRDIIIPAEIVGEVYPIVEINNGNLKNIFTGKPIYKKDLKGPTKVKKDAEISVFCGGRFIGMYRVIKGKEIFAKAQFVLQPIK
ncbi:RNA-guided pseudouridylation complex pseudouridine synthase subunit Cbf5 [Candidatus Pacearchaeota archaeon]|nr:RNA-guided pseudouridylation complex pseudouridine synthase subunit Cbf5 [Candidatus Pacearchaeota archaeon]